MNGPVYPPAFVLFRLNSSLLTLPCAVFAFMAMCLAPASAQSITWNGSAGDLWSTAGNWDPSGDAPVDGANRTFTFTGSSNTTNTNDLTGLTATGITFSAGASSFVLGGNSTALTGNILNSSPNLQTIALDLSFATTRTITAATGSSLTINGSISGAGGLTKAGGSSEGMVTLSGNNSYTGVTTLASGAANPITIIGVGELRVTTLANGGQNSSIGASASDAENLVINQKHLLVYVGSGNSTDRLFTLNISSSSRDGGIASSGSGPIAFTNTGAIALPGNVLSNSFVLGGTNTGANVFSPLIGNKDEGAPLRFAKIDSGTWRLTNNNTYTSFNSIADGVLEVTNLFDGGVNSSIGASTNVEGNIRFGSTDGNATLRYVGDSDASTDRLFRLQPTVAGTTHGIESSGLGTLEFRSTGSIAMNSDGITRTLLLGGTNTSNNTFRPGIGNAVGAATSLLKSGPGTWVLEGTKFFSGSTTIAGGTLTLNSSLSLLNSFLDTANSVAGNATAGLRTNVTTLTLGGLTGDKDLADVFTTTSGGYAGVTALTLNPGGVSTSRTYTGEIANGASGMTLTKNGTGTQILSGNNTYTGATTINAGTLLINGSIAASPTVSVATNGTLGGSGVVSSVSGAGRISPGNSPGILTATDINFSGGIDFSFELTATDPTWSDATDSANDVFRLTDGADPFNGTVADATNVFDIYFGVVTIGDGDSFVGGIFSELTLAGVTASGTYNYFVLGDGLGSNIFNGVGYYTLAEYDPSLSINQGFVFGTGADFQSGTVDGYSQVFDVIPEPGTSVLLGIGSAFMLWNLRRRRDSRSNC